MVRAFCNLRSVTIYTRTACGFLVCHAWPPFQRVIHRAIDNGRVSRPGSFPCTTMSAITQFASSLWQTTTAGVANIAAGPAMAAVSTAMFEFSQRFPTPRKRWHAFVMSPIYVLPLLAMILAFVPEQGKAPSNFVHRGAPIATASGAQSTTRHRHGQYFCVLIYFAVGS